MTDNTPPVNPIDRAMNAELLRMRYPAGSRQLYFQAWNDALSAVHRRLAEILAQDDPTNPDIDFIAAANVVTLLHELRKDL